MKRTVGTVTGRRPLLRVIPRLPGPGVDPWNGSVGDALDDASPESVIGLLRASRSSGTADGGLPTMSGTYVTAERVDRYHHQRQHSATADDPPAEYGLLPYPPARREGRGQVTQPPQNPQRFAVRREAPRRLRRQAALSTCARTDLSLVASVSPLDGPAFLLTH
ncbi:hypothetical protein C3Y87_20970 [Carbonactinospora thermoautotrophica]|nr:hypothetical protein [Carbonactinospora thermoautotrophica]